MTRDWKTHPGTLDFLLYLEELRQEVMEKWADNHFVSDDPHETVQKNARAIGEVQCIDGLIELIRSEDGEAEDNGLPGADQTGPD